MTSPGQLTVPSGWQLDPPSVPTSIDSLSSDQDPSWIGYMVPWNSTKLRRCASYVRIHLPKVQRLRNVFDIWVTRGWEDNELSGGAVWDDLSLHFVIDMCPPVFINLIRKFESGLTWHENLVKDGVLQRQARAEGKSDDFVISDAKDSQIKFALATTAISTELRRPLPQGCKWLFLRVELKALDNDRSDVSIVVLDERGELAAVSQHVCQIGSIAMKQARPKASL